MTDILYTQLAERFCNTEDRKSTLSMYGADERIHMTVAHKKFSALEEQEPAIQLANKVFEGIPHHFGIEGKMQPALYFENLPFELDHYHGHCIEVAIPNTFLQMTFWTGNRGKPDLETDQRKRYFEFSQGLYRLFLRDKQ